MKVLLLACILALASPSILARTMDRCSLARKMSSLGVPRDQLNKWTCIAEHESRYRTHVVGPPNADGSNDHGLFQINDRYWCQPSNGHFSHNGCGMSCNDLRSNRITRAVRCAQKVLREQGWTAWSVWHFCSGNLPPIDYCFR